MLFWSRVLLYTIAAIASAIAARRFGWWREHLGRGWTLFSLEFLCLLANYILRRVTPDAAVALNATLVIANVAQIAAYWLMSRVLVAAGIGFVIEGAKRIVLTIVALAVAIILCHGALLQQWELLRAGDIRPGSLIDRKSVV